MNINSNSNNNSNWYGKSGPGVSSYGPSQAGSWKKGGGGGGGQCMSNNTGPYDANGLNSLLNGAMNTQNVDWDSNMQDHLESLFSSLIQH